MGGINTGRIIGHCVSHDGYIALGSLPVALAVYFCVEHLDRSVALLVARYLYDNEFWARHTSSLPDLLFMTVLFTSAAGYLLFRHRVARGVINLATHTCLLLAITAPVAFTAKSVLKFVFGRINTREWLVTQGQYGFHWFQGGGVHNGFPSGHMTVFTALIAVVWRLHPRYRRGCGAFLLLMAVALVVTDYHFVSDVIAGAYLGLVIEVCIWRIMTFSHRNSGGVLKKQP